MESNLNLSEKQDNEIVYSDWICKEENFEEKSTLIITVMEWNLQEILS